MDIGSIIHPYGEVIFYGILKFADLQSALDESEIQHFTTFIFQYLYDLILFPLLDEKGDATAAAGPADLGCKGSLFHGR